MTGTIPHLAASLDDIRVGTASQLLASCPREDNERPYFSGSFLPGPMSGHAYNRAICAAVTVPTAVGRSLASTLAWSTS